MSPELTKQKRLLSLDAYRGLTMFLMVSAGFGLDSLSGSPAWSWLARQVDHVAWEGCVLWDLIQPSFIFIVGVAMPFAFAIRSGRGESRTQLFKHAFWRALLLLLLGVGRICIDQNELVWNMTTVLQQIAVAYFLAFFVLGRGWKVQLAAVLFVLVSDWALFQFWPGVGPGGPYAINANWHSAVEQWVFGHTDPGGYTMINCWGSTATVILGIMSGELLHSGTEERKKAAVLMLLGAAAIALGLALSPFIPVVKRIWTPSWVVFSGGWAALTLGVFYLLIDVWNLRRWPFVFTVVGMNCITIYMVVSFLRGEVNDWIGVFTRGVLEPLGPAGVIIQSCLVLAAFWYMLYWMYKRGIFLKVG